MLQLTQFMARIIKLLCLVLQGYVCLVKLTTINNYSIGLNWQSTAEAVLNNRLNCHQLVCQLRTLEVWNRRNHSRWKTTRSKELLISLPPGIFQSHIHIEESVTQNVVLAASNFLLQILRTTNREAQNGSTTSTMPFLVEDDFTADCILGFSWPVRIQSYRVSDEKKKLNEQQVMWMRKKGVTSPLMSPWSSPVVLVAKKEG